MPQSSSQRCGWRCGLGGLQSIDVIWLLHAVKPHRNRAVSHVALQYGPGFYAVSGSLSDWISKPDCISRSILVWS